jgi:hypothetical protein
MPVGSTHVLEGVLLIRGASVVLRVDDGGQWRLRCNPRATEFVGQRVAVEGLRIGFDLLDVRKINPSPAQRA